MNANNEERKMVRASKVKPMMNYLLLIEFDNGEKKIFNCHPLLEDNLYIELKEPNIFNKVYIDEMGVVCWNNAVNINPYNLYEQSELLSNFVFAE